ncbi:MAG: ChaB family protein [Micromonospora sp.]
MENKHEQAEHMRPEVPSTVGRSDDKAVRTYKKTLESAEETYGDGERAHRTAFAALKHTHEKVGDHWEPKEHRGPSDEQAELGTPASAERRRATAQGVDANASKGHLDEVARKVGIGNPQDLTKDDVVRAIEKANARATARARARKR